MPRAALSVFHGSNAAPMLILVCCLVRSDSTLLHSNKLFVSSVCLGFELGLCLKLLSSCSLLNPSQLLKVISRSLSAVFMPSGGCRNEALNRGGGRSTSTRRYRRGGGEERSSRGVFDPNTSVLKANTD